MRKKSIIALSLALVMLFAGCGKKEEVSSEPEPLPIEISEGEVTYYEAAEEKAGLVPETVLKLSANYAKGTLNASRVNFRTIPLDEFLETASGEIDGNDIKDAENSDFCFHGFAVKVGTKPMMYAEFTKDKKLVETWNESESSEYKLKALYTSSDLLSGNATYLNFGTRIYVGLTKDEIESTDGKGYTSGYDINTFYYPDDKGYTLALSYSSDRLKELYQFRN